MKIGVYIENSGCYQVDCSQPSLSNPGIGGTEYCLFLLAELYQKHYPQDQVYLFVNKEGKLPQAYKKKVANSLEDVLRQCREEAVDVLLIKTPQQAEAYALIQQYKIKVVVWGHNFYFSNICRLIAQTDYVRGNVFVGKQMYDRYIDDDICRKSTYIYNCCPNDGKRREENNTYHVTYIGSLVESKGFHVLAKHWKKILHFVPQAQLYVIGSGILYDKNAALGKLGIADQAYESRILPFITDQNGNLLESVHFLGSLGKEKVDVILNTAVGIVNPTGRTETFGLSAIDFEQHGIPVVTVGKNGLLDTVKNKLTGTTFHFQSGLPRAVSELLMNKVKNEKLGRNGIRFSQQFEPQEILPQWKSLFEHVFQNQLLPYRMPNDHFLSNFKFLRICNRTLRSTFSKLPSLIQIETALYQLLRSLR